MRKLWIIVLMLCLLVSMGSIDTFSLEPINFTLEEQNYIDSNPVLTLAVDPEFIPFEFVENGVYQGIASDYIKKFEERLPIDFQVVENLTWVQAYGLALDGQIDVLPAISKTAAREDFLAFSEMYYEIRRVIVTRNDRTEIKTMNDLEGLTVAVQTSSSHHTFLSDYPNINLSLYNDVGDALTAVSDGREVAFIGNLATTDYLIKSNGLSNLRFTALPNEVPIGLHFAVLKENTVLLSIINKTLSSITLEERIEIHSKWVTLYQDPATDYTLLLQAVIIIFVIILLTGSISLFWIYKLRKEIDERKVIAKELEQAKSVLEDTNQMKSTFMARMSHEIRTPLNAITGMTYLLKKTDVSMTQRVYIDRINQASINMLSLINDILDFSKIEASNIEIETIEFNLDQVIHNMMSILAVKLDDKGLGFRLIKDPKVPTHFYGDPKRIEQIFINLLNNAIKFTTSGEVLFEVDLKALEGDLAHIIFTVKDTGIGMSKETIKNLFKPFQQADSSINRRFGGSGLGLSIVKHLVELMGGDIQVYSTLDKGSTFIVNLSLKVDTDKEGELSKDNHQKFFKDIKVLVVDKNTANLNIMKTYLNSFGVLAELTTSGYGAKTLLEHHNGLLKEPFDLVIVDYETTEPDGIHYLDQLNQNELITRKPKMMVMIPMQRTDLFDVIESYKIDAGVGKPIISSILHNTILELFIHKTMNKTKEQTSDTTKTMVKKHKQILVVDDNQTNQLIAKLILEQAGYDILTANNGYEAVLMYKEKMHQIHLILMDIHMPLLNGYDAAKEIHQLNPNALMVAMTAEVTEDVKLRTKEAFMEHYISKPFDPDEVILFINDILSKTGEAITNEVSPIDLVRGLNNLGNQKDLYHLVIKEYVLEHQETNLNLKTYLDSNNYQEARALLHKFVGSTSSIGATKLSKVTQELSKVLHEKRYEDIPNLFVSWEASFIELMNYLRKTYHIGDESS